MLFPALNIWIHNHNDPLLNFLDDIALMNWYGKLYMFGNSISWSLTGCNFLHIGDIMIFQTGKWSPGWAHPDYVDYRCIYIAYTQNMSTIVTHSRDRLSEWKILKWLLQNLLRGRVRTALLPTTSQLLRCF